MWGTTLARSGLPRSGKANDEELAMAQPPLTVDQDTLRTLTLNFRSVELTDDVS
jgi:hypothetical protein